MGVLRFSYGTMSSGKSTLALQIHHNLAQHADVPLFGDVVTYELLCRRHFRTGITTPTDIAPAIVQ